MSVRALCITVLKSAGDFTRDDWQDVSAEKIQRVKLFRARDAKFVARGNFTNAGPAGWVRKFQPAVTGRLASQESMRWRPKQNGGREASVSSFPIR